MKWYLSDMPWFFDTPSLLWQTLQWLMKPVLFRVGLGAWRMTLLCQLMQLLRWEFEASSRVSFYHIFLWFLFCSYSNMTMCCLLLLYHVRYHMVYSKSKWALGMIHCSSTSYNNLEQLLKLTNCKYVGAFSSQDICLRCDLIALWLYIIPQLQVLDRRGHS